MNDSVALIKHQALKGVASIGLILILLVAPVMAKNVDLSTVPTRDTVQLTIYNSEDLTLVRETRQVSFKKGVNPLQFSWANTLIDPTSVELRFLTDPDKLVTLDTTFPHNKPQMLYWNVASEIDGQATIEITYFTSGITWSADYVAITDPDEMRMGFEGFVRVHNNSGEEYEDAQVRLVVGTINLVEKVANLARVRMDQVGALQPGRAREFRNLAAKSMMMRSEMAADAAMAPSAQEEKKIIKEGLSEYFIYTIEGTETISNGWSKRMRSFEATTVPFKIQYRYRPQEYGNQLVRMFLLRNDEESGLGTTPLPDGVVRLFRRTGRDGLSFLVSQSMKYVPIGDKIELNLGQDPRVIFELIKLKSWRDNIWMRVHGANVFKRVDDGKVNIDVRSSVAGWDDHDLYTQRIRNYSDKPIDVEIRRSYNGHVVFRSALDTKLHDYRTVQFSSRINAGQKSNLLFEVLTHQSRNAKQNNVTLEGARLQW